MVCTLAHQVAHTNPFTPLAYQPKLRTWNGDQNGNFIDDRLDPLVATATNIVDVIVLLNKCLDPAEVRQKLQPFGNVTYVGQHMTFVTMTGVKSGDLPVMAALADVAMIEQDAIGTYNLNVSTRAIRVRASTTFSPSTVEDAFPGIDGTGIGIAVLDSGVDDQGAGAAGTTHTFFPAAKVVGTYDAVADNEGVNPDDTIGHGTHVAGIALGTGGTLGTYRGVAPNANLIDMLIGSAAPCTSAAMRAVDKCIARKNAWGICVIQTSFGIGGNENGQGALCQIFNYAVQQGLVAVAAAGNSQGNLLACPAAADDIITVASFDDMNTVPTGDDAISGFSNTGPRLSDADGSGLDELKPDVAAPGSNITSAQANTTAGTVSFSGTSMAAPHVSGVAALICQAKPGINPLSVKDLIKRTADDRDGVFNTGLDPVFDVNWGQGAVNAFNALSLAASTDIAFPNAPPTCCGCPDIFTASAPIEGTPNTLTVVVRNNGPGSVVNATISFGVYVFGNGAAYYSIAQQTISIPAVHPNPAATINVSVPWTPQGSPTGDPHACLKAQIGYGPDTVFANNSCQRNINIQQTSTATYRIQVENNLELPAVMEIVPRGPIDDRWRLEISTNNFLLDPFSCPKIVPIRLTSPLDAQPEDMVHIVLDVFANQFGTRIPQGGVEIIGCKPGGEPPVILEGEVFPGGREIIVQDDRSGIAFLNVLQQTNGYVFIPPHRPGDRTVVLRAYNTNINASASFVIAASDCATNRTQQEFVLPPTAQPVLTISRRDTNLVVISWTPNVGALQEADEVTGPWFDVPGASNPYGVEALVARRFYRLGTGSVVPPEGPMFDLPEFSQLPADATGLTDVRWNPIPGSLDDQLAGQIRAAAEVHPQVAALLGSHFHFISVTEVLPAKDENPVAGSSTRALATFYSYANNWTVEASTIGLDVVGVTNRTDHQPHESESEIEEAIAAARRAPNIEASVQNLLGTGLLRPVDDPLAPGFGHRVIYVGFVTNGGGDGLGAEAPLFFAEYDVNDQRILASGSVGEPPAGAGLGAEGLFPCAGLGWPTVYQCTNNPAQSATVNWTAVNGNNWQFSWHANTGCGLAIRNVRFNGRYYIYKLDLPVVKVRYTPNVTGPFNDIINWGNMKCIWRSASLGTQKVCVQSYFSAGRQYLVVWVYCCIGSYRIVQAYHFCDNGVLYPRLGSKGLQACANHVHCPFWQIDYDINGTAGNDRTWRFVPPWTLLPAEAEGNQPPFLPLLGQDCLTGRRVWVYGSLTGPPHFCCPRDYALRLYKSSEGCPWPGGAVCAPIPWNNGENVNCRDNVLWQIGHLYHNVSLPEWLCAQLGFPGDFKWTGPLIRLD